MDEFAFDWETMVDDYFDELDAVDEYDRIAEGYDEDDLFDDYE